jgi:hypothetical protein
MKKNIERLMIANKNNKFKDLLMHSVLLIEEIGK